MNATRALGIIACLSIVAGLPSSAQAKVPSPANSDVPPVLTVVERDYLGNPDPLGEFRIVVRDLANTPEPGDAVVLDFSQCTDLCLSSDQSPSGTLNCSSRLVAASTGTDAGGVVTFRVLGHADHSRPATSGMLLRVFADGVLIRDVPVAILDQDGNGLGPTDISYFLADFFSGTNPARSDYNGDGIVGVQDLSRWLTAFFGGQSTRQDAAPTCP